jgi:hypothetical protein
MDRRGLHIQGEVFIKKCHALPARKGKRKLQEPLVKIRN